MPLTPEQRARKKIDRQLAAAGWAVQDHRDMDIHGDSGVAVQEYSSTGRSTTSGARSRSTSTRS